MVTKKDLIIVALATFCLTATLFTIIPTRSLSPSGTYDPWVDTNDDGAIDIYDALILASRFNTNGTAIDKTALLYQVNDTFTDLLSKIDSLNASMYDLNSTLISRLNYLESRMNEMNATIAELQYSNILLNASISEQQSRIDSLVNAMNHSLTQVWQSNWITTEHWNQHNHFPI